MSLLLVIQVLVISLYLRTSYFRPPHPKDGVTAFHMLFVSLDLSLNYSRLTIFIAEGKRVFHVSILSSVSSGKGYISVRISYGQDSTYHSCHT